MIIIIIIIVDDINKMCRQNGTEVENTFIQFCILQ